MGTGDEAPLHPRFGDAGPLVRVTEEESAEQARTGRRPQSLEDRAELAAAAFYGRDPDPGAVAREKGRKLAEAIAEGEREDAEERRTRQGGPPR